MKSARFLLLLSLLLGLPAQASVWDTTERWSKEWEERYSEWVLKTWNVHIFTDKNSPYNGLRTDCADTVYSMRAIFSFEHGLPFAIKDPSGGTKLITNEMSRFDSAAKGPERLKAFLRFLYNVVDTQGLPRDTYPIAVNRDTVRSGTLILEKEKKHSFTVKEIRATGTPYLIYSTQKNTGPLLVRESYPSISWLFPEGVKEPSGIRAFRPIEYINKNAWEVPGYSTEQYEIPYDKWTQTVTAKLALQKETTEQEVRRIVNDICQLARKRVDLVNEAMKFQRRESRCMNAAEYDDMSTPSRDGQIKEAFRDLDAAYKRIQQGAAIPRLMRDQADRVFAESTERENSAVEDFCPVEIKPGRLLSLGEVRRRLFAGKMSSNPNDSFERRWGEEGGPSARRSCPEY